MLANQFCCMCMHAFFKPQHEVVNNRFFIYKCFHARKTVLKPKILKSIIKLSD